MSAREIASAVGTSDATVVRTAQSLGYESLRELRRSLADDQDDVDLSARLHATISASASAHDVLATAVDRQVEALGTLLRRVPSGDFDRAAAILAGASRLWWCGTGPSAHLAEYAAFLCRRLGTPSGSLTHSGTDHADELLAVQPGDAVVVLAYGRIHPYVRVLLQHAAKVGAQVVLITDALHRSSPEPIAVQLGAGRGSPGLFATHGPTIVLLEALVLAVAGADTARSEAALTSLNELRRSIAGKRVDVDPE
ncbi:MAG: transcriptional regulator [Actinomycetia bacterium]|nr:transcriptional regulator [Actinomycetes bacterium]